MSSSDSDSSSSDEEVEQKTVAVTQSTPEEDSSSSDSDSEEEEPKKVAPAKAADDSSSDSDSSDDEEEAKPAPAKEAVKPAEDSSSDSDSSDDEEEKPEPKKEAAAPAAAADDDSSSDGDSSDDEEEEKPEPQKKEAEKAEESSSSSDEVMEDVEFTPTKANNVTVLFEWNISGKEAVPRKRKLSTPSLPAAKKQAAPKAKEAAPPKAESKPAKESSGSAKEVTIEKEYNPDDFRSAELKDTTDTIFVKGIDVNAYEKDIKEFFTENVAEPVSIRHKWEEERPGLAWVTFATPQQASKAVIDCNREYIKDRYVFTDWAKPQQNRGGGNKRSSGPRNAHLKDTTNRVWCGNVHREVDEDSLRELFKETGEPTDVYIIAGDGYRPQIAFVSFETNEIATQVVENLQGSSLMGSNIRLDWAEPRKDGGGRGTKRKQELSEKPDGCVTCFVGRLSDSVDDDKLQELFKEAGEITGIRYMERDGEFKGVAFVEFADTECTDKAVLLNGTSFLGKNIRVDFAASRKKREY